MASKKIQFDVGVNTSELDKASSKVGELKKITQNISIQYDINGKPLDIAIDKSLNLKKQVVELTKALRTVKEGSAEFQLLTTKLGDANDKLAQSNAKSRDFLATLGLIPGPIGEIAAKLNGTIGALKLFSGFSFKDVRFQLKELNDDLGDIIKGFTSFGKAAVEAKDTTATAVNTVGEKVNTAAVAENTKEQVINSTSKIKDAAATEIDSLAVDRNTLANIENNIIISKSRLEFYKNSIAKSNAAVASGDLTAATLIETDVLFQESLAQKINTLETEKNALVTKISTAEKEKATVATTQLAVAEKEATTATLIFNLALKGLIIGTVIGAIFAIGNQLYRLAQQFLGASEASKAFKEGISKGATAAQEATNKVLEVGVAFEQAKKGAISKGKALEIYNEILGGTIGKADTLSEAEKLYESNTNNYIKSVGLRAEAQELFSIAAKKSAEAITAEQVGFFSFDRNIGQSYEDELNQRKKKLTDASSEIRAKAIELLKEASSLETGFKPKETKGADKGADDAYQKLIADLDAQIQLEINKENTRREVLQKLLDKKRKLVTDHDKLTYNQVELLKQENSKKIEDALNDDNKVLFEKLKRQEEIRVAAIDDEEQRELEARENQLYYDKIALQAQFKTQEEFDEAAKNLQIQTDRDLLDIRDKFFQKRYKQEQDAFLKEQELRTKNKENELAVNQQRIDGQNDFNTLYGDFIFGTKGLKAMYEKNFIDLRKVYQDEYDNDMARYTADEELLKTNLANKGITQATYDEQIIQLNDKRIASAEKNTTKQIELDKLEVDSKRASADMTIQVGERLVGLLSAVAGKNIKLQKAAAILDAGVSIARIITDTSRAIIAFGASVAPLGPAGVPIAAAYSVKAKISAGLAIATIIAQGIGKLKSIDESSLNSEGGSGQGTSSTTRGMARGGYIDGPRHAGGGVMINAEGGEAVMTRGAVSMFGPMLSMMNQAGGGVSFNSNLMTTRQDNPILSNPAQDQAPIVVKTYVVEKDMVSQMNKQARLKDLSTL
jgi:hypothetical protein